MLTSRVRARTRHSPSPKARECSARGAPRPNTPARLRIDGVHAANARRQVESGGVLPEARQHARSPDEGHTLAQAEAPRPAGQARDRAEGAVLHHPDLAVPAVVDPQSTRAES